MKNFFLNQLFLIKVEQNQGFISYVAPDCKASKARIGVASLRQSAWVKQHERPYRCFAARCRRILQGRFSHAQTLNACSQKPLVLRKCHLGRSCGLQVDVLLLQQDIQAASLFAFCPFLALMSSLRPVFVTFLREKSKRI